MAWDNIFASIRYPPNLVKDKSLFYPWMKWMPLYHCATDATDYRERSLCDRRDSILNRTYLMWNLFCSKFAKDQHLYFDRLFHPLRSVAGVPQIYDFTQTRHLPIALLRASAQCLGLIYRAWRYFLFKAEKNSNTYQIAATKSTQLKNDFNYINESLKEGEIFMSKIFPILDKEPWNGISCDFENLGENEPLSAIFIWRAFTALHWSRVFMGTQG